MGGESLNQRGEKTVVILQPGYLPWLGFFDLMFKSDVFVIYDDVQFDKHGWRNRNRIKTPRGALWLTVPVLTKGRNRPTNREILVNNCERWAKRHIGSLRQYYSKAPFYHDYFGLFEQVLNKNWEFLIDLDMALIETLMNLLGFSRRIVFASDLSVSGGQTERLVAFCRHMGARFFLEGDAGRVYLDEALFAEHGIELQYHAYRHPVYRQLHGDFLPYMSVVDLLFNHGPKSLGILSACRDVAAVDASAGNLTASQREDPAHQRP
jgi:hypothetical protein